MSFYSRSCILFGCLLSFMTTAVEATTVVITSAPPPPREVVVPPQGRAQCHMMPSGFYHGIWTVQHRVCEYPRGKWVAGYYQCLHYKHHSGVCVSWSWMPSHWEGRRVVAYGSSPIVVQPAPVVAQPAPVVVQPVLRPVIGQPAPQHVIQPQPPQPVIVPAPVISHG